jgi:hypothetical protein
VAIDVLLLSCVRGGCRTEALEPVEGATEPVDLLLVERAGLDAPERLSFHELAQELDHGQDELNEAVFETLSPLGRGASG